MTGWLGMDVFWTHWMDRLDILAGMEIFGRLVIERFGFDAGKSVSSLLPRNAQKLLKAMNKLLRRCLTMMMAN